MYFYILVHLNNENSHVSPNKYLSEMLHSFKFSLNSSVCIQFIHMYIVYCIYIYMYMCSSKINHSKNNCTVNSTHIRKKNFVRARSYLYVKKIFPFGNRRKTVFSTACAYMFVYILITFYIEINRFFFINLHMTYTTRIYVEKIKINTFPYL